MTIICVLWFPDKLYSLLGQMMALRTNVKMVASEAEALALS